MDINSILEMAMDNRERRGLKLTFDTSAATDETERHNDLYTCFPKDEEQKTEWLASAARKGWKLV